MKSQIFFIQFKENFPPLSFPKIQINYEVKVFYNGQCSNKILFIPENVNIAENYINLADFCNTLTVNLYTGHI